MCKKNIVRDIANWILLNRAQINKLFYKIFYKKMKNLSTFFTTFSIFNKKLPKNYY